MPKDLRIIRTETRLKEAFLDLIATEDFTTITVLNLCKKALVNRITFYQHYKDKYDLLNDIFKDMQNEAIENLPKRESINNLEKNPYKTVSNYLYYFVEAMSKRINLVVSIARHHSEYIYFAFANFFEGRFKEMVENSGIKKTLKYDMNQTIAFVSGGVMSFIVSGVKQGKYDGDFERLFYDAKNLFLDILQGDIIYKR